MEYVANKNIIAKRIARIFKSGDVVNLGIGLPTLVGNYVPEDVTLVLQSENGMLGLGPAPAKGQENWDLTNAGSSPVTVRPGGYFFDSAMSFGIIRGGHVDYTVLGVLEVDQEGNLANYKIPGKMVPGMGGAMDLVTGAKRVIVAMEHCTKDGDSRLLTNCSLPLTAKARVSLVVTELAVMSIAHGEFVLHELAPGVSLEHVKAKTQANLKIAQDLKVMAFPG